MLQYESSRGVFFFDVFRAKIIRGINSHVCFPAKGKNPANVEISQIRQVRKWVKFGDFAEKTLKNSSSGVAWK